jgi:hypothetical protein
MGSFLGSFPVQSHYLRKNPKKTEKNAIFAPNSPKNGCREMKKVKKTQKGGGVLYINASATKNSPFLGPWGAPL